MENIGEIIKTSRNSKKIPIEKISQELKISKIVLDNIENNNFEKNKDIVFYIGHIRSYSKFLELDSDEIIKKFKKQISFSKSDSIKKIPKPKFQNNSLKIQNFIPVSLIVIIFTSFYILFIKETDNSLDYALIPDLPEAYIPIIEKANLSDPDKALLAKKDAEINIQEKYDFTSVNASINNKNLQEKNIVTLKILNSTWLQIRDESNNIIISQLMNKNEEYSYDLELQYNITSGNGGNILVIINDNVRGKIGEFGEVVDSIILDNTFNN